MLKKTSSLFVVVLFTITCTTAAAETQAIQLEAGWNMVSIMVSPVQPFLYSHLVNEATFQGISIELIADFDPAGWNFYSPRFRFNNNEVSSGMALLIYSSTGGQLELTGENVQATCSPYPTYTPQQTFTPYPTYTPQPTQPPAATQTPWIITTTPVVTGSPTPAPFAKVFGGSKFDQAFGIAVDELGNTFISGRTSTSGFGGQSLAGDSDAFVAKYTQTGNVVWTRLIGGSGYDFSYNLCVDTNGNVYVTGYTESLVFDGLANAGLLDAFITKFDANGNKLWTRLLGGTGTDSSKTVAVNSYGGCFHCWELELVVF